LFTPDRVIISETIIINRPVEKVFPKLSNINEWPEWHPWFRLIDKNKYTISQTDSVTNSFISWTSNVQKGGEIKIIGHTKNKSIQMEITYEKDDFKKVNQGEFLIESQAGRTKVSWILVGTEYPFFKKPATIVLKGVYGKNYEVGMENLKALCEGRPLPAQSRMDKMGEDK
jgi:uncharacterized membrane protein